MTGLADGDLFKISIPDCVLLGSDRWILCSYYRWYHSRFFVIKQSWQWCQYWHQRLYNIKTKKSSNKMLPLPPWVLNPWMSNSNFKPNTIISRLTWNVNFCSCTTWFLNLDMSHFTYACKMRYPLNLVLESWEYLWFYWTFCIVILDYGLKLHKLSNHTLVMLQKWLEIH